jgi:hypothetical protein
METTIAATTIIPPDTGELAEQGRSIVARAEALAVDSPDSLELAGTGLREIKTVRQQIKALFDQPVGLAHKAHKAMVAARNTLDSGPAMAEAMLKRKVATYQAEEERKRRAEEDRLRELARVEAEERQLAEAVAAEAAGNTEEAAEIIAEPIAAPVVVVAPAVPKLAGVSTRETWKYRIVDESKIPRDYMMPDDKKIGAYARSMKSKASMPGVEFYSDSVISARSN